MREAYVFMALPEPLRGPPRITGAPRGRPGHWALSPGHTGRRDHRGGSGGSWNPLGGTRVQINVQTEQLKRVTNVLRSSVAEESLGSI